MVLTLLLHLLPLQLLLRLGSWVQVGPLRLWLGRRGFLQLGWLGELGLGLPLLRLSLLLPLPLPPLLRLLPLLPLFLRLLPLLPLMWLLLPLHLLRRLGMELGRRVLPQLGRRVLPQLGRRVLPQLRRLGLGLPLLPLLLPLPL